MKHIPRILTALTLLAGLAAGARSAQAQPASFYKDKWGISDDSGFRDWLPWGPTAFARGSEAGFGWTRYWVYWNRVQPTADNPSTPQVEGLVWQYADAEIDAIRAQGMQVYANIMWAPSWAVGGSPGYEPWNCMDVSTGQAIYLPNNPGCSNTRPDTEAFKKFVRETVLHYSGRVRYFGFWNEPNDYIFWHSHQDWTQNLHNLVDYILIPGYEAAKAADPNVQIVGPEVYDPTALAIILERDRLYHQATGKHFFDVISFHAYEGDMANMGANLDRYNDASVLGTYRAGRPVWLSETGADNKDELEALFRIVDERPWIDRLAYHGYKAINCADETKDDTRCHTATTSGDPGLNSLIDLTDFRLPPFYAAKRYLRGAQIFTGETPAEFLAASPGWEAGTQFSSSATGFVKALRFWRAPGESGNNTLRLWTDTGVQLASATIVDNGSGASGWQEAAIAPVEIQAGVRYRVSVNTNTAMSKTGCGLGSGLTTGPLTAHTGLYGQPMGAMPTTGSCSNFFVDVTFEPGLRIFTTQVPDSTSAAAPGYEVGMQFSANRNGSVKALRFWRAAGETGDTVVRLWTDSGTLLAAVTYRDYGTGTSGWQQLAIPPVAITANTRYRVSFNTNTAQAKTGCGIGGGITKGPLTAHTGLWGQPVGSMPLNGSCSNFFADVVFE